MNKLSRVLGVAALVLATGGLADDKPSPKTTTQVLMRQKLEAAHGVLEGVVREDFPLVAKHAEMLANVGRATTWHKADQPDFMRRALNFQAAADDLLAAARAKSRQGIQMGYLRLTLACMECHDAVRAPR